MPTFLEIFVQIITTFAVYCGYHFIWMWIDHATPGATKPAKIVFFVTTQVLFLILLFKAFTYFVPPKQPSNRPSLQWSVSL